MEARLRNRLFLAFVAAVALLPFIASGEKPADRGEVEAAHGASASSVSNAMAVDAVPGGGIDSSRVVSGRDPFEVSIVITDASIPYTGYQYWLEWDPAVLAFDSEVPGEAWGVGACTKVELGRGSAAAGCVGATSQFVGPVSTARMHCVADGESPLVAAADMSTTFREGPEPVIDTTLAGASIACQDVGPAGPPAIPPANDSFSGATVITGLPFRDSVDTAGAGREGELDNCNVWGGTVWYRFTAEATEFVQADTFGSDFDTAIAVHVGGTLASLTPVACNDDTEGLQSRVVAELEAGRTYYFQVGGFTEYRGLLVFNVAPTATPEATPNAMAVDAVSGGARDPSRTVSGVAPFDVDIAVTSASRAYVGYQYRLRWDPAVLAYDGQAYVTESGFGLCGAPAAEVSSVEAGCARMAGAVQFAGPVATVTFHCVADGSTSLELVGPIDSDLSTGAPPVVPSTTIVEGGKVFGTTLLGAFVTCVGAGGEAGSRVSPTPQPIPPLAGTGGYLHDR